MAILQNQGDFLKMIKNQGDIMAQAAERGVSGKSLAKMLVTNQSNFGMTQAMRSRGLTSALYRAKAGKEDIRRQLKSDLNKSFSKVAVQPIADIAPPPPAMGNPGMALMMGMANAVSAGIGGMDSNTMDTGTDTGLQNQMITPPSTIDYGDTFPAGSFGIGSLQTDNLSHMYF